MQAKWRTYFLCACLVCTIGLQASELSDKAQISLLTCSPGKELYAKYGHTALRVCDSVNHIDIAFNYGIFDFNKIAHLDIICNF